MNSSFVVFIPKKQSPKRITDYRPISLIGCLYKVLAKIFEKAYDSVSWDFLRFVLEKMGFSFVWRKWISECLSSASVFVLVNGSPTKEFRMGRGHRQGDPLSPFLFLLVAGG